MNAVINQLNLLAQLQCKNNLYFTDGLFASERVWAKGIYKRNDNTAFFSACIGFTLKRYMHLFNDEETRIVNSILEKLNPAFELYRNKDGHASYNFWQTKPSKHFPGGYFAKRLDFFMIPDDIDDSAMIHLVKPHSREEQLALKAKMERYAIGNLKWPDKPVKGYENRKSYNTFFVKNMPAAFDVCALSNALYFICYYKLPLSAYDDYSLDIILTCLDMDDHIKRPYAVAPYYPNTVLIIYHIVRLMFDLKNSTLLLFKDKVLGQINMLLARKNNTSIERLILTICKLKIEPQTIQINEPTSKEKECYPYFVAGLLGEVRSTWLRSFSSLNFSHIKYQSAAYSECLWLEYLILNKPSK